MAKAKNNPDSLSWMIVGGVAAIGAFMWYRRKKQQEVEVEEEFALEAPMSMDEAEVFEEDETWVEEAPAAATAAVPSTPTAVAAVLADPDPSPAKENKRNQASMKLVKLHLKKGKKLNPKDFKWKSKRTSGGFVVIATRKTDRSVMRFLVKKDGKITRLKKAAKQSQGVNRAAVAPLRTAYVRPTSASILAYVQAPSAARQAQAEAIATRGLPASVRKLIL